MAITFDPNNPGNTITIGGDNTSPFPSYSISRQDNYTGDDTYLSSDFTITVNGVVVVDGDPTVAGELNNLVQQEAIDKLGINDEFPMLGFGTLTIAGYSGNEIIFKDAHITSVQTITDEESGGFRYQPYTITFQATVPNGATGTPLVAEMGETWSLEANDNQFAYSDHDISGPLYKTFTLTHTISARGRHNPDGAVEAWRQAVLWVETRIQNKPDDTEISTHINLDSEGPKFVPYWMNSQETELKLNASGGSIEYESYNGKREITTDIASGSYEITDTWLVAIKGTPATHSIDISKTGGQEEANTVTLNGVVTGLDSKALGGNTNLFLDNYDKAEAGYLAIKDSIFGLAAQAYGRINPLLIKENNGGFNPEPISRSLSQNRIDGTITWSATYDDAYKAGNKNTIASEDVNVEYKNQKLDEEVIAVIPVIDRAEGPVIQSFRTENIRSVSVTVSLVMTKTAKNEETARAEAESIADAYDPGGSLQTFTYEYTEDFGLIVLTKEWLYK